MGMYGLEVAELPALVPNADRPLVPPPLEAFLEPPTSRAERLARAARVVRMVTIALAVAFVLFATTATSASP